MHAFAMSLRVSVPRVGPMYVFLAIVPSLWALSCVDCLLLTICYVIFMNSISKHCTVQLGDLRISCEPFADDSATGVQPSVKQLG